MQAIRPKIEQILIGKAFFNGSQACPFVFGNSENVVPFAIGNFRKFKLKCFSINTLIHLFRSNRYCRDFIDIRDHIC